jgi:hypothetical protein
MGIGPAANRAGGPLTMTDRTPYYVAFNTRFSYVRSLDAARQRLADYLGTTADDVRDNRRRLAGLIKRVSAVEARATGV